MFVHEQVRAGSKETDGQIFIPATLEYSFVGTWTKTRTAAGDYNMLKTAGADSTFSAFPLNKILKKIGTDPLANFNMQDVNRATRIRGAEITSVTVVWKNTTQDLTSATLDLHRTTHVGGAAQANPTVLSTVGGTLTGASLTVTASANVRAETVTLGTPYILGNNTDKVTDWAEVAWVAAAGSVLTVYGIFVNFNYVLL